MAKNVFETLEQRGYFSQATHKEEIYDLLSNPGVSFYIGFDPTADSLHVGHFVQMMVMSHMQKAGHRPIALMGGGTGMIGDPSGRTDMRQILTLDTIDHNVECFKKQMSKVVDFTNDRALIVNNADWLRDLNYLNFLRDIGPHFSVNKMLTAECYKQRLEKGLSFIEFNYMLLQAYDFYYLHKNYNCSLEFGGDDQWSNILAGMELIRRKDQASVYGLTFTLLTNSEGKKMGKTAKGAVWLDPNKFSVYDFYQYWRNVDDADVIKCMKLLTFLDMDEIEDYAKLKDSAINEAKKRLAYEVTAIIHGREAAEIAQTTAQDIFENAGRSDDMKTTEIKASQLADGLAIADLMVTAGIVKSKGEAKRMIQQKGVYLNDAVVEDPFYALRESDFDASDEAILRKGKKNYYRIKVL
ncbi:MAG: tyrosine--tRNA ligase [Saccharofermentans sp.]|jgi:tyrosyl-tRNA synthetase|nr:tyrosine--tRNA ligase [Mageeibacillus sp.]MCI1264165.1 tyrosine--tRNA ligase [Saccharofermentans sp.]MCI1275271.1 tyrosine--tRNA ligase [Saccharofermentans sp.]MCI1768720.1 tyrosine--tRNA ligase [Mageeibacillus sp.]